MKRVIHVVAALALSLAGSALAQTDQPSNAPGGATPPSGSMQQGGSMQGGSLQQGGSPEGNAPGGMQGNDMQAGGAMNDQSILMQLHRVNLAEIQEGQLAEQNGQSKKVRKFGKELVKDHEKADKEVQKEAKKLGMALPAEPPADQGQMQRLQGLTGADFDREFVRGEIEGHQKTISMLQTALPQTQEKSERKTIDKIMPVLEKHLKTAQKLQREVGQSASAE